MPPEKKWYEYPRPIPFDDLHRRILQDSISKEHKLRRRWENKYKSTLPLYRADIINDNQAYSIDKPCFPDRAGTSMQVGAPTSERINYQSLVEPAVECEPVAGHEGWNQCEGVLEPFCQAKCEEMLKSVPQKKQEVDMYESICECPQRFRKLKFPPKCNHVCARMGFDCWMCHAS